MNIHQSAPFLRAYSFLPQSLLNRLSARLSQVQAPASAVQAAIRLWIERSRIDMSDYEETHYPTLEAFFLRQLRPGARPLSPGIVSPVDGHVFAAGAITADTQIELKGHRLSLERVVNGRVHTATLSPYIGGHYAAIFLSPRGYHHVHAPCESTLLRCQWLPGRYFPQNAAALAQIPRVYERNERAALFFTDEDRSAPYVMVMVGASLVGGIHLAVEPQEVWQVPQASRLEQRYQRGERLGHFSFGSTVVLLFSAGQIAGLQVEVGQDLKMGQTLARPR
jgi:phosphatidylserine decarboxylase